MLTPFLLRLLSALFVNFPPTHRALFAEVQTMPPSVSEAEFAEARPNTFVTILCMEVDVVSFVIEIFLLKAVNKDAGAKKVPSIAITPTTPPMPKAADFFLPLMFPRPFNSLFLFEEMVALGFETLSVHPPLSFFSLAKLSSFLDSFAGSLVSTPSSEIGLLFSEA